MICFVSFLKDVAVLFLEHLNRLYCGDTFSFACNYLKCLLFSASLLNSSAFFATVNNRMQYEISIKGLLKGLFVAFVIADCCYL